MTQLTKPITQANRVNRTRKAIKSLISDGFQGIAFTVSVNKIMLLLKRQDSEHFTYQEAHQLAKLVQEYSPRVLAIGDTEFAVRVLVK